MRYFKRFGWCFLISFTIVLAYTLFAAWDEAGDIGFLEGNAFDKVAGLLNYWLFWIALYTGVFYLIVSFVLALLLTFITILYDLALALWKHVRGRK